MSEYKDLLLFESICHTYGLDNPQEKAELMLRVLKTRQQIVSQVPDAENLYKEMQKATFELPRFKGDAELFFQIYSSLVKIDAHGILFFLTKVNLYDRGHLSAPDIIVKKFGEYITNETKTIFIPECESYGMALLDEIETHPDVSFTLSTRNEYWKELLSFVYSEYENVSLVFADIYRDGFSNERYDLILTIPVFGSRSLAEGQDFICKDSEMIAVQNLLYHVNLDGHLIIVLPAKILFVGGNVAALRDYIEKNYQIKEISALPAGLFSPYTSIKTFLFDFSNGSTEEVMIRKYELDRPARKTITPTALILAKEEMLFPDEFADLNGWNIEMALENQDDDLLSYNNSSTKKALLSDIATMFRGKAVNEKTEGGSIGVINISNLSDAGIDYTNLEMLDEEERKVARYALEDGDVLITARGTTIKVAVFEKQAMTCIPSANFNVVRPGSRLRGMFLKIFLESPVGIKLLKSLQRGFAVMNINYKDLGDLEIPLLPLETQDMLIQEYNDGLRLYKKTIAAAEEGWRGVQQDIQSKLF